MYVYNQYKKDCTLDVQSTNHTILFIYEATALHPETGGQVCSFFLWVTHIYALASFLLRGVR